MVGERPTGREIARNGIEQFTLQTGGLLRAKNVAVKIPFRHAKGGNFENVTALSLTEAMPARLRGVAILRRQEFNSRRRSMYPTAAPQTGGGAPCLRRRAARGHTRLRANPAWLR